MFLGLGGLLMGGCTVHASIFLSDSAFCDVLQAAVQETLALITGFYDICSIL